MTMASNLRVWRIIPLLLIVAIFCPFACGKIIYVDDDAIGTNDGSSWENAYTYLQDALIDANSAEKPVEIRVAQGIYKPNQGVNISQVIFFLINEVTLVGGYAGVNEHDPNERNIQLYETILSGDLASNDIDVNNLSDLLNEPTRSDNGPIIYSGYSINQTAVLDGFVITGGRNTAVPFELIAGGGGIRIDRGSSPTISNCTLIGNAALACGGGMLTRKDSNPTIINCKFIENYAGGGGGVYNASSNPVFSHCLFKGNYARIRGGGMGNSNELFWGLERNCNPVIINCIFSDNFSESNGGGISFDEDCNSIIVNCSFNANFGKNGKALSSDSLHRINNIKLTNCILWDDGNEIYNPDGSEITIDYTNLFGGTASIHDPCNAVIWGKGNIYENPLFVDPGHWDANGTPDDPNDDFWVDGDYHLKSQVGRWNPVSESWIQDDVTSPCIDVGDPNSPIGHEPFPNGGIINMGAYGSTIEASKSPSGLHAKYGGGTGEPNDPYLIYTAEHMNTIGLHEEDWDKHFKLMADIDLSAYTGTDFNIIGYVNIVRIGRDSQVEGKPFTGVFDGNGHTISNFSYHSTDTDCIGIFKIVSGEDALIKNLGLINPENSGQYEVGSLVGEISSGTVSGCYVEGGSVSGNEDVGGLVGYNFINGTITNCYSTASVSGSYNLGGLIGYDSGDVISSFWDIETSGQTTSSGGTGTTTVEMQTAGTFIEAGWDFVDETANGTEDVWWIIEGQDYPRLWWQASN